MFRKFERDFISFFVNKGYPFSMFVTKRRYFDFVALFCLYQVCLKCRKLIYESFSNQWTVPAILLKISPAARGRYTYHIEGQFHFGFILFREG